MLSSVQINKQTDYMGCSCYYLEHITSKNTIIYVQTTLVNRKSANTVCMAIYKLKITLCKLIN